jgi:hypothetical protein
MHGGASRSLDLHDLVHDPASDFNALTQGSQLNIRSPLIPKVSQATLGLAPKATEMLELLHGYLERVQGNHHRYRFRIGVIPVPLKAALTGLGHRSDDANSFLVEMVHIQCEMQRDIERTWLQQYNTNLRMIGVQPSEGGTSTLSDCSSCLKTTNKLVHLESPHLPQHAEINAILHAVKRKDRRFILECR